MTTNKIADQSGADERQWIDANQIAPGSETQKVIVWCQMEYAPSFMHVGTYVKGRWDISDSRVNGITGYVSHWMELPKSPRETALQAQPSALPPSVEADDDAENGWRRLALQFDNHRMQAIWHLKRLLGNPQESEAADAANAFLSAGPLPGEQVLADRIEALATPADMPASIPQNVHVPANSIPQPYLNMPASDAAMIDKIRDLAKRGHSCTTYNGSKTYFKAILDLLAAAPKECATAMTDDLAWSIAVDTIGTNAAHMRTADDYVEISNPAAAGDFARAVLAQQTAATIVPQEVQATTIDAATIVLLQKALSFWLPRVPAWGNDVSQRIEQDAWLLCGLEPEYVVPCAQDLGIVTLIDPVAAPIVATVPSEPGAWMLVKMHESRADFNQLIELIGFDAKRIRKEDGSVDWSLLSDGIKTRDELSVHNAEPDAYMQIGLPPLHDGERFPRIDKPALYNPDWWQFKSLYYAAPISTTEQVSDVRKAAIDEMVNRFLGWKLPSTFAPDCGILFKQVYADSWPTGTNLFHAGEAKAMFQHCCASTTVMQDEVKPNFNVQSADFAGLHTAIKIIKSIDDGKAPEFMACVEAIQSELSKAKS